MCVHLICPILVFFFFPTPPIPDTPPSLPHCALMVNQQRAHMKERLALSFFFFFLAGELFISTRRALALRAKILQRWALPF